MATWQFDFHLIPQAGVIHRHHHMPATIPLETIAEYWRGIPFPDVSGLDRLLPRKTSYDPNTGMWGDYDRHRIDISDGEQGVESVFVRISLIEPASALVSGIVAFAAENNLLIHLSDGKVMRPILSLLAAEIRASDAARFSGDPEKFLKDLSSATP